MAVAEFTQNVQIRQKSLLLWVQNFRFAQGNLWANSIFQVANEIRFDVLYFCQN